MNFIFLIFITKLFFVSCMSLSEDVDSNEINGGLFGSYEELVNNTINNILQNISDPLESNFTSLDLGSNSTLISGEMDLKKLKIAGIRSLTAKYIKVDGGILIPNHIQINLTLPELTVNTSYLADLKLLDGLPFFGHGELNLSLGIKKIEIGAHWEVLKLPDLIQNITIDYEIDEFNLGISGLYDSVKLSQLVEIVANNLKDILNGMSGKIGSVLGDLVKNFINGEIRHNTTLGEIFEQYSYSK